MYGSLSIRTIRQLWLWDKDLLAFSVELYVFDDLGANVFVQLAG